MTETPTTPATRTGQSPLPDVVCEIDIEAPPAAVFAHLVEPDLILRWIGLDGELDVRPGGAFHIGVTPDDRARGAFVEIVPDERVEFTWGWDGSDEVPPGSSTVRIELEATTGGTHVRLTHSDLPTPAAESHGEGWRWYLPRLAVAATGGDPGPEWMGSDGHIEETP